MYEVVAKLDKQNRITIPNVVRHLIGDPRPGDVIKVIVVEKVVPKDTNKLSDAIFHKDALTA
jgi:bifunctional DNA-binding transcriptional regulator/antitoxin component of YhaV-PrlF toxin-antitoxin module